MNKPIQLINLALGVFASTMFWLAFFGPAGQ